MRCLFVICRMTKENRLDRARAASGHYVRQRYAPALGTPCCEPMRAMTTWFCDAYASWQKGGVENANGRLRRWLPRQIDIDQVSDEEIQDIVITANLTPRKCLGFKTPFQAILKELGKDVQIRFA